jgi:membrane protease YdiL (CAAX protease family)
VQVNDGSPWPPPSPGVTAPPRPSGWYQAADGGWYETDQPPAPGWWLASDLRWYPPQVDGWGDGTQPTWTPTDGDEAWRWSRWGLGDCWWGGLVFIVASIAIGVGMLLVLSVLDPDTAVEDLELGPYAISVSIVANVLAFAGVPWLASKRKGLASLRDDFGLRLRPVDLAIGFGFGVGALVAGGLVAAALTALLDPEGDTTNVPVDSLDGAGEIIAFALAVAVITPIIEELFFRGLLHRSLLKRGARPATSFAITTLVFVLPHLIAQPSWPNVLVLFAVILVYGSAFHLACHVTDNRLGAPIVAHVVVNGVAVLVVALS